MATAAVLDDRRTERRGQLYVALAAIAWSSAGLLQRGVEAGAAAQVGVRALFACVALFAYVAVAERGRVLAAWRAIGVAGVGVAAALAVASAAFIVALNHTTVAHVLFIQAIAPVLAALLARGFLGEPVPVRTTVAMAIALAGVGIMVSWRCRSRCRSSSAAIAATCRWRRRPASRRCSSSSRSSPSPTSAR
jgi:drug/metabolite transporter (DMT)-like permease